jgi:hypothetical protein
VKLIINGFAGGATTHRRRNVDPHTSLRIPYCAAISCTEPVRSMFRIVRAPRGERPHGMVPRGGIFLERRKSLAEARPLADATPVVDRA